MARSIPSTVALASIVVASSAAAQAPPAKPPAQAEPAPAYEDRLIEGGNLKPAESEELAVYNSEGLPRAWRVEGFLSRTEQGPTKRYENGMVLSARLDTLEYGAFTFDGTIRNPSSRGMVTLWQRAMPFDRGWIANNGLGMLNTPMLDIARQQFRFYLPTFPIAGATTEWIRQGNVQLQASVGEPGTYNGLRLSGFSGLGGSLLTAGAQWNAAKDVTVGAQVVDARDVEAGLESGSGAPGKTSARSIYGAFAYHDAKDRLQLNVLDSETSAGPHRMGIWAEGESAVGRYRHNYGAFRFDPGLMWGYTPINGDLQGAYYRLNYASQQWIWSGGVDSVGSVTGQGLEGVFVTGNVRYQVDHSLGVGGGLNLRHSSAEAGSVFGFVDKITALGTTRVQIDAAATQGQQNAQQLSVDQAWATRVGLRLSTTLTAAREHGLVLDHRRAGFSAFGGIDLTNNLSLDGSIRWGRDWEEPTGIVTNGRYANLGLVWRITPRWSLLATYYDNRVEFPQFIGIGPILPVEPAIVVPKDRAMFLTVRYEDRAGTAIAPLGGVPGAGAGTLVGYIFYDANDDGRRGANEQGAANVTVVLDGRFGARTGVDGRFEFPLVAAGPHSLVVIPDNLALPYSISEEGKREIVIRTRETTTLEIAAQRVK